MQIGKVDLHNNKSQSDTRHTIVEYDFDSIDLDNFVIDLDLSDKKSFDRYVLYIKSMTQGSRSYRRLMNFLKNRRDMSKCHYLPKVKYEKGKKVKIEIHHMCGTISDIIATVIYKRAYHGEPLYAPLVVKEIMECHYRKMVSLVPTSSTIHDLLHAEESPLFIPIQHSEFGNSKLFYEAYKKYMDPETRQQYELYFAMSEEYANIGLIPHELTVNIRHYRDVSGTITIPVVNDVKRLMGMDIDDDEDDGVDYVMKGHIKLPTGEVYNPANGRLILEPSYS